MSDLTDAAVPYIGDFGQAKYHSEDKPEIELCGTKGYMAPEVIQGWTYSFKVDVWGLGIIIYKLICGYLPFPFPVGDLYEKTLKDYAKLFIDNIVEYQREDWFLISTPLMDLLSLMLRKESTTDFSRKKILGEEDLEEVRISIS